jgi:hypothetical protein
MGTNKLSKLWGSLCIQKIALDRWKTCERVAHARREMEHWLVEAEEWRKLKGISRPLHRRDTHPARLVPGIQHSLSSNDATARR